MHGTNIIFKYTCTIIIYYKNKDLKEFTYRQRKSNISRYGTPNAESLPLGSNHYELIICLLNKQVRALVEKHHI